MAIVCAPDMILSMCPFVTASKDIGTTYPSFIPKTRLSLWCAPPHAVRIEDNTTVVLRRAATWSEEIPILQRIETLRSDPRNHAAPLLDIILLPWTDDEILIVIPLLRQYHDPPFSCPDQVLHALEQFLEMMEFLHENLIAHRDFCSGNLLLDPTELFPDGFHFVKPALSADAQTIGLNYRDRTAVSPISYFVIDFELSTQLPHGVARVTGVYGADRTVPELSWEEPYNPFKVDIYQFGRVILVDMVELYSDLEFLRPLAEQMTRRDPGQRPTAGEALQQVLELQKTLSAAELQREIWIAKSSRLLFTPRPRPPRRCCS